MSNDIYTSKNLSNDIYTSKNLSNDIYAIKKKSIRSKNLSTDIYQRKEEFEIIKNRPLNNYQKRIQSHCINLSKNLSSDIYNSKNLSTDIYNKNSAHHNKREQQKSILKKNPSSTERKPTGKKVSFKNLNQENSQETSQESSQENRQENSQENSQDNKTKRTRNRNRNRKNKLTELVLMYANVNGIKEKINSIQQNANACGAHIILATETKQIPPKLQDYDKWKSKERKKGTGGGVGICARKDIR